jgi:putative membrane protein
LSSTSSSAEQAPPKRSATEVLASRYRHLFVLPSAHILLIYAGLSSLLLSVISRGLPRGIITFLPALAVFVLSVFAISSALLVADKKSIATFRRTAAALLAGEILWLICAAVGVVYVQLGGTNSSLTNAIVYGAFLGAGLEFLVINGAFTGNTVVALGLAAIQPASTLAVVRLPELSSGLDIFVLIFGAAAFATVAGFVLLLSRRKTSRGYGALYLFRSFMKTWAAGESSELEATIWNHGEDTRVTTKILRFQSKAGDTFIVIPGVHPGPFHAVGSYDLPGVLSRAFKNMGRVVTLHRPGGHEKNLASTMETARYADEVSEFAATITPTIAKAALRGPLHADIGNAKVSSSAFSEDLVLTISFAPLGSDDLSSMVEDELARKGSPEGFETSVVDAHNSIDHEQESPDLNAGGWKELLARTKREEGRPFSIAYSHSSELNFPPAGDLTENGVGLVMVQVDDAKHILVLADANNAVPPLRANLESALGSEGYRLLEFCTSDSHNLAARGLTVARGYQALGEETPVETIVKLVVDMAKLAEGRLSPCAYGSGTLTSNVRVFGSKALEEFATITQASSKFGRAYFRFAAIEAGLLLLFSLFL